MVLLLTDRLFIRTDDQADDQAENHSKNKATFCFEPSVELFVYLMSIKKWVKWNGQHDYLGARRLFAVLWLEQPEINVD